MAPSGLYEIDLTAATYVTNSPYEITLTTPSATMYTPSYGFDDYKEKVDDLRLCVRNPKLHERSVKASQRDMNHRHYLRAKSLASSFKKVEPRAVSPGKMH